MNNWDLRIDGDTLLFRAGFSADSRSDELSHSLHNAKIIVEMLQNKFHGDLTIFLSNAKKEVNPRFEFSPIYKANRVIKCKNNGCKSLDITAVEELQRSDSRFYRAFKCNQCEMFPIPDTKPIHFHALRQYLIHKYTTNVVTWGEADDWLGVAPKDNTVIVSNDKDLLMLPAHHYRLSSEKLLKAEDPGKLWISEDNKKILGVGFKWFVAQLIMGDAVDNIIKPKKGFGPVAVYDILSTMNKISDMWEMIKKHYGDEEKLLLNAKLLWISREPGQVFSEDIVTNLIERYDNEDNYR